MLDLPKDRTGQQFGSYHLHYLLKHESIADVYQGEHIFLKTQATIKILPEDVQQEVMELFLAQVRSIAHLKHPNIPRMLEFGLNNKTPFLVTDYISHTSLRDVHPENTQVPSTTIMSYVRQITAALQYLHEQGLVYGMIRPDNVFFGPQNRIVLNDFSLTTIVLNDILRHQEKHTKYLAYIAPEQWQGQSIAASDQYALAATIYEWLSGNSLPSSVDTSLVTIQQQTLIPSPELKQVLITALEPEPSRRFVSIRAFAQALEHAFEIAQIQNSTKLDQDSKIIDDTLAPTLINKPQNRRHVITGVSLSFILLILLIGSLVSYTGGFFSFVHQNPSIAVKTPHSTVTAFTTQSPQEIYTTATTGNPFINDPLTNKDVSTWQSPQGDGYSCAFANDGYHIQVARKNIYLGCFEQKNVFHNFAFEVEMSIIKGDGAGIIFRSDSSHTNFYALKLSSIDSAQSILSAALYSSNTSQTPVDELQDATSSINIYTFNLLTVVAYDHSFYFYVNQKFVMTVQNSSRYSGAVGFYIDNNNSPTVEATFRNARIWKL